MMLHSLQLVVVGLGASLLSTHTDVHSCRKAQFSEEEREEKQRKGKGGVEEKEEYSFASGRELWSE